MRDEFIRNWDARFPRPAPPAPPVPRSPTAQQPPPTAKDPQTEIKRLNTETDNAAPVLSRQYHPRRIEATV